MPPGVFLTRLVVPAVQYFDVNAGSLSGGLDRFSQFFVAPLFTASATSRELNAIESEHAKNINSDSFRVYQVGQWLLSLMNLMHSRGSHDAG